MTWKNASKEAAEANYTLVHYSTIMTWYRQMFEITTGDYQFQKSECGASSLEAASPFKEDESLFVQFKSWENSELSSLTIRTAIDWVNTKLLDD